MIHSHLLREISRNTG